MKIRLLLALVGLAISFALPIFALPAHAQSDENESDECSPAPRMAALAS
jgi:hypothetical protein